MKKCLTLFANLLLIVYHIHAQSVVRDDKLIFKAAPVVLLNQYLGLRMGMEYKPTTKIGLQAQVQFPVYVWHFTNREENYRSYQLRGEARYYHAYQPMKNGASINYLAVEGFYIDKRFDLVNDSVLHSYYINRAGETKTFDKASVHQRIWVAVLKYGRILDLGKRFSLDFHVGLGVRFYDNRYQTVNETDYFLGDPVFRIYNDPVEQEGKEIRPHLALGLKVGYRIW